MGDERDFKINITGDASGIVGASRQGADALKGVAGAAGGEAAPALDKLSEKTEEAGKASARAEVSHRAMRFGLRALGPEIAELGHAILLAMNNPVTAVLMLLALIVQAVMKVMDYFRKLRELIASEPDLGAVYKLLHVLGNEGMLKAFIDGGVAAEEFWGKINRLSEAQQGLKEKTDEAVEAIKKEADAQNKQMGEREKSALALVDSQEKLGGLTAGAAAAERQAIRDRFEQTRGVNEQLAAEHVIEERRHELEVAKRVVSEGPEVVGGKSRAEETAAGTLAGLKAGRAEMAGFLTKEEEFLKGAGKGLPEAELKKERQKRLNAEIVLAEFDQDKIPEAERTVASAKAEREIAEKRVETATALQQHLEREIPKLTADLQRQRSEAEAAGARRGQVGAAEALQRLVEISKNPDQMAATEAAASREWSKLPPRERANPRRALTGSEVTEAGVAAVGDLSGAVGTAQAFEAHKQTTTEQQRQLMEVTAAIAGHRVGFREAVAMMSAVGKDIGLFTQDVGTLVTMMKGMSTEQSRMAAEIRQIKAQHRESFNQ